MTKISDQLVEGFMVFKRPNGPSQRYLDHIFTVAVPGEGDCYWPIVFQDRVVWRKLSAVSAAACESSAELVKAVSDIYDERPTPVLEALRELKRLPWFADPGETLPAALLAVLADDSI